MRPTTPNFNFSQQSGPSSPPHTPTATATATMTYAEALGGKSRRHAIHFTGQLPQQNGNGSIIPNGDGPSFFYNPSPHDANLSPRSSSPDSSVQSSTDSLQPRSMTSSPIPPVSTPPRHAIRVGFGSFTVNEFQDSDYEDFDSDENSVIRPHEYEDAESSRAPSPSLKSISQNDIDQKVYAALQNLQCDNEDFTAEDLERDMWMQKLRAEKRRRRRSSCSVQKRTLSQSIGSDTDDEDLQPVTFENANSARRLRRKVEGSRASLIFDDPPPRIDELEEPESCEEIVEVKESDEEEGLRELPYYVQDMDVDSDED